MGQVFVARILTDGSRFIKDDARRGSQIWENLYVKYIYMLYVICYMLYVICYMLYVICYMLYVICYMLYVICYMLYVICYMLYVICYMLYVNMLKIKSAVCRQVKGFSLTSIL